MFPYFFVQLIYTADEGSGATGAEWTTSGDVAGGDAGSAASPEEGVEGASSAAPAALDSDRALRVASQHPTPTAIAGTTAQTMAIPAIAPSLSPLSLLDVGGGGGLTSFAAWADGR